MKAILRKFGYIHESEITDEYLLREISRMIGDPLEYEIDPEQELKLFTDLSGIEGLSDYLTATMAKDMQRDFTAGKEQTQVIHGAFARTAYLKSKLKSTKDTNRKVSSKLKGLRYS